MQTIATGGRLPPLDVTTRDGARVSIRPEGRTARVLVTTHPDCDGCAEYVRALASHADDIREWDGRVIIAATGDAPAGIEPFVTATVDAHDLADAGIPVPGVLIADQWGELFEVHEAGGTHGFLPPEDVVEWLRYLAIVCPECQGEAL